MILHYFNARIYIKQMPQGHEYEETIRLIQLIRDPSFHVWSLVNIIHKAASL